MMDRESVRREIQRRAEKREASRHDDMRRYLESTTVPAPPQTPWAPTGKDQRFLRSMRIDPQTEETWR